MPSTKLFSKDIAKKTDGEAEDTGKVANDFNGEDEGHQPPDRTHKVLDVFRTVKLQANDMGEHDDNDRTGSRGIETGCGREETRDHSHIVAGQNEEAQRGDQRKNKAAFFAGDPNHEIFNTGDNHLKEVLSTFGNHLQSLRRQPGAHEQDDHGRPSVGNMRLQREFQEGVGLIRTNNRQPKLFKQDIQEKNWMLHILAFPLSSKRNQNL